MRALRRQGIIPATINQKYGQDIFVQVNEKRFDTVYRGIGSHGVLFIALGDQLIPVTVERVERGATSSELLHVEFAQVHAGDDPESLLAPPAKLR
jgi:ribosomal protein L25 (general stress protein Ctc)